MKSKKAKQYLIDNLEIVKGCDVLMISTVTATEAIKIAEKELKEKAIEIYKRNCRLYQPACLEDTQRPCPGNCEYLKDFITEITK